MSRARKIEAAVLSVLVCFAFAAAEKTQSLKVVPDPSAAGVRAPGDTVSVEWVQLSRQSGVVSQTPEAVPLEGYVYYAAAPAGGDLAKYTPLAAPLSGANGKAPFSENVEKRVTRFVPNRQSGRMGPGVYYVIVASFTPEGDTLYSDYINLMVASSSPPELVAPKADVMKGELVKRVTDLAPVFSWKPVPGVPYYHIVLSDVPFVNSDGKPNAGVNIIWQAITPATRISYGAPDPSGTITAPPPPLSPGTTYSWMVLNNYGNRPAFTSWDVVSVMDGVAGRFLIEGNRLAAPAAVSPAAGSKFSDGDRIEFKWAGIDPNANSYLVNLLREGSTRDFGMGDMGNFSMSLLAWETTVPRGGGDTLSVALDAGGTLTGGDYLWRVYALDKSGAASTAPASASTFKYSNSREGYIKVSTSEKIGGVALPVGYVELKSEVVSGPTMSPLLFYTNGAGRLERVFSAGTYRISAVKEGYPVYTKTVTVAGGDTAAVDMLMSRSEAVLYGRVLAASDSSAVSAGRVTAVSEWGDTVSAVTDGGGAFVLACRAADWVITAEKPGFRPYSSGKITLRGNDNRDFGGVYLARNPFALSGVVRNSSGSPVMGAQVRVLRDGAVVDELASTPQSGVYAFYLTAGTYTVTAEKPGFAMFSRSVAVAGTMAQDITIREGAVLVSGVVTGKSWVAGADGGKGGYVYAPVTSARLTFEDTEDGGAKFTVASDAVFGKFSVSLPPDRNYAVTASAAGFAASGAARGLSTGGAGDGLSVQYDDTLVALAAIKGSVKGADGVNVDVLVYDADGRIVASAKSVGGAYEVRNIPDGKVVVGAGADGYFSRGSHEIDIEGGSLEPNQESYDFTMEAGYKSVGFKFEGYTGGGAVKVLSPLNRTLFFAPGAATEIKNAGGGNYIVEAAPDSANSKYLELSYHKFYVPEDDTEPYTETLHFPFTHTPGDTAALSGGKIEIGWPTSATARYNRITLYYRSEGSARFDSLERNVSVSEPEKFSFTPARDGCDLYYYFRLYLENESGDIYGSGKQLYRTYVKPDAKIISRVAVEPGAAGGDTLVMPSSYRAAFAFRAFYGDQFAPVSGSAGGVAWSVLDSRGAAVSGGSGTGMSFAYVTPDVEQDLTLRASFTPLGDYKMKEGAPAAVEFTLRVTGKPLKSINVLRKGDAGAILNTETAGFRVQAFDEDGKPVTVSPQWDRYPRGAGSIDGDGLFTPSYNFVGTVGIVAAAGGLTLEYTEPGADAPGQRVNYAIRGGDTANTQKGMRVIFGRNTVRQGAGTHLEVTVPRLTNYVHRGTENYSMADSAAFDLSYSDVGALDSSVTLAFDIPEHLREAAKGGGYEFRVARWFPDSLRWIPVDSGRTRVEGGVVTAVLSPASAEGQAAPLAKAAKAAAQQVSKAAELAASARYALVVKTGKTSLAMSVSPHPFSPYIIPVKEHGLGAKAGTCIKVNVQAPEPFVKSVKVRIHNATGKMVWGIEKLGAQTGENAFWWNGRTSGRGKATVNEEVWSEDYYERNAGRPLCRNGRYYVMVIVTDMDGKQRRAMKPLVLMK